jgi:gliding motility-associated protein GldE
LLSSFSFASIALNSGTSPSTLFALLLVIILLLAFLAMLGAAEIAFFSLKPHQIKEIRINAREQDDLVARLLQNPKKLLASILILVNFTNVGIIITSAYLAHKLFDFSGFPVIGFILLVVIITSVILLFGLILPKVYAAQHVEKTATKTARTLQIFVEMVNPLSKLLVNTTIFVDKQIVKKNQNLSMSELEEAIDITSDVRDPEDENKILRGIVNFGEKEVKEVMQPRIKVTAVENTLNFSGLLDVILEAGYSRVPVYQENLDSITGILYTKELIPHFKKGPDFPWIELVRPAFFVPENKHISDLLEEFQRKKIHLAIVVDEYGGTSGIVTLEDILEEIVGEIQDEFDLESEGIPFHKLDDHNYVFPGEVAISDFCRIMGIDPETFDKVKGESGTLAGIILEMLAKIPEVDEKISYGRFLFRIEAVNERRIEKVKITIADDSSKE